ncbi:alpha-ketoglutarate-dependent sulfonate dioxygenase [Schizopora paradoxa]|uniref:Alpha-ketoglutarate-dependent sulfonate dioxygenase n=1 Tax=Schizopora paradoxa TaxID=27342 RepID=A0A0H2RWW4_9AGAM|nr:alpha-ketoglutarate-dependent sulfonate dioxygenase [Schizopora paradoxa]
MAPVATETATKPSVTDLKATFNPFYSPAPSDDKTSEEYEYDKYKPHWPKLDWQPLETFEHVDRGLSADPTKKSLFGAAKKVVDLTPVIGTEIEGLDLSQLTNSQKDELALLVAERGVVFFRDQRLDAHQQLDLGRHFGRLHKHATTGIPKEPGLEEVHVVYTDSSMRPNSSTFSKLELWHSDVSYELQPPCTTSLKGITIPPVGGDTLFSSGYALYSSLSKGMQTYLEGLSAVHSAAAQAQGSRAAGLHVRRHEIETIHPVVRVHPVTGWKSVYVNPGFTRRIVGVSKAESDAILQFLFHQISENPDFQVRFRWEKDSLALWDNRIVTHSATFDFWPQRRHALRATPHGERPISVADYERTTGKVAKDRQVEIYRSLGIDVDDQAPKVESGAVKGVNGSSVEKPRGYND